MNHSPTILLLPGGGYGVHASHEGEPVADWLQTLGFQLRVVKHPLNTRRLGPVYFVQRETHFERAYGALSIGVLGFSAGGHLPGLAAASADSRPDFGIRCYPVVSMLMSTHRGSREVLLGRRAGRRTRRPISGERLVEARTKPVCLRWLSSDPFLSSES